MAAAHRGWWRPDKRSPRLRLCCWPPLLQGSKYRLSLLVTVSAEELEVLLVTVQLLLVTACAEELEVQIVTLGNTHT